MEASWEQPPWFTKEPQYEDCILIEGAHTSAISPDSLLKQQQQHIMPPNMSLFAVQAILILSTDDGSRIFAKYHNAPHHTASHGQCRDT